MKLLTDLIAKLATLMAADELDVEAIETTIGEIDVAAGELAADPALDDTGLATLVQAAEAVEGANTQLATLEDAAADRAAKAKEAVDRIRAQNSDSDGDDDGGESDTGDGDGDEGDGDDADGDADGGTETDADVDVDASNQEDADALAAAGGNKPPARTRARRPKDTGTRQRVAQEFSLVASANAHIGEGKVIKDTEQLADVFGKAISGALGYAYGPRTKVSLASTSAAYADQFTLDSDADGNEEKMNRIRAGVLKHGGLTALAAAGGACAPYQVMYDQQFVGTTARPVRDQYLARMKADRGGVTHLPTIELSDVMGAVEFWDDDNGHVLGDAGTTTKPHIEVPCDGPVDVDTYAITAIVQFGNFQQRYFKERVETILKAVNVALARKAERKLITLIAAACDDQTTGQQLGSARDIMAGLDRALAYTRQVYRLDRVMPMKFGAPMWLLDNMRTDVARGLPGTTDEQLAVADAVIESWFKKRGVTPVWFMEGETGQEFTKQGDGALAAWKSTAVCYLTPDGEDFFLDGGGLDLGIVRDSTLNGTNKFQVFSEVSEGYLRHGATTPLRVIFDICPDGSVAATRAITPCTIGS